MKPFPRAIYVLYDVTVAMLLRRAIIPFTTLKTRRELGRVTFAKTPGTVTRERLKYWPIADRPVPETLAGHNSTPVPANGIWVRIAAGHVSESVLYYWSCLCFYPSSKQHQSISRFSQTALTQQKYFIRSHLLYPQTSRWRRRVFCETSTVISLTDIVLEHYKPSFGSPICFLLFLYLAFVIFQNRIQELQADAKDILEETKALEVPKSSILLAQQQLEDQPVEGL